jgi:hypothetical protein
MRRADDERRARQREHMGAGRTVHELAQRLVQRFIDTHGTDGAKALQAALDKHKETIA